MKTIWVFGCSHTAGHGCTPTFEYYEKYYKDGNKLWSQHLAQYLKMDVINRGKNGASNDMILDTIIDSFDEIKSDDIVIIGNTYSHRFDVPQKEGLNAIFWDWETFAMDDIRSQFTLDERRCIMDFQYYFMLSPLFGKRWMKRWKFIQKRLEDKGCRCIVWDVWEELKGIETIKKATDNKIDDGHMSFKGHLDFSNLMWNKHFVDKKLI
jgi:hypothetical protein